MANVEIYTTMMCGFCARAKNLLNKKSITFDEVDVTFSDAKRQEMMARADGRYTVPQIFINGKAWGAVTSFTRWSARGVLTPCWPSPRPRRAVP